MGDDDTYLDSPTAWLAASSASESLPVSQLLSWNGFRNCRLVARLGRYEVLCGRVWRRPKGGTVSAAAARSRTGPNQQSPTTPGLTATVLRDARQGGIASDAIGAAQAR